MPVYDLTFLKLHGGQQNIASNLRKRTVIRAGRRFGKSTLIEQIIAHKVTKGQRVGLFAPQHKLLSASYNRIYETLSPIITSSSRIDGRMETLTKGCLELWSLDNEDAGRSRWYNLVVVDEAGLMKKGLKERWTQAIAPTLVDKNGDAIMAGTPKGIDDENYFYQICTDKSLGWTEFHAPTWANPTLSKIAVEEIKRSTDSLTFSQEYAAEFVNWSGVAFFSLDNMLENGMAVEWPTKCDYVYAVVDTAMKGGSEHDSTAVAWFARSVYHGHPLVLLDYDLIQIDSGVLDTWLINVIKRTEELGVLCGARHGSSGVYIEDKGSGTVLIQQLVIRGLPVHPIDSALTSQGKDERALAISSHIHCGKLKLSKFAYDKVFSHKGITRNHLIHQVTTFRLGDKESAKRADDALDVFVYGVHLGVGTETGY